MLTDTEGIIHAFDRYGQRRLTSVDRPEIKKMFYKKLAKYIHNRSKWFIGECVYFTSNIVDWLISKYGKKRGEILLVVVNELGFRILRDFANIFENDSSIGFIFTESVKSNKNNILSNLCKKHQLRRISFKKTRFKLWSAIVFADHDDMSKFSKFIPKIRISHGIGGSKIVNGVPYRHDKKWIEYRGRMFYTKMFESSEHGVAQAVKHNPKLKDISVAVGDYYADKMFEINEKRKDVRVAKGYCNSDFVILIQSTFGPHSLIESIGKSICNECIKISKRSGWKFIIQMHPNIWNDKNKRDICNILIELEKFSEIRIVKTNEESLYYIVLSDMVVTDHTSLSMMCFMLNKPMLFYLHPKVKLTFGEPRQEMSKILPKIKDFNDIEKNIINAKNEYPVKDLTELQHKILSYKGESKIRIQNEVYKVLCQK